jgi:diguanylate cyclase (GGDEF)-like protein
MMTTQGDGLQVERYARTSQQYVAFKVTEGFRPGELDQALLDELEGERPFLPVCPIPSASYRMLLPEGLAAGAPRLFLAGGDPDGIAEYSAFLDALGPHWSERRALRREASLDFLTGVYNYRHLRRTLRRMCRRATKGGPTFSVLMVDVDHLREYNTAFGHLMGSRVLSQIGRGVKASIREGDFVAKYGGDEFVVILPGAEKSGAVENAFRIRTRIKGEGFYGVEAGAITCSIGVATFGEDGTTYEELVGAADRAVYAAKDKGRNTVVAIGRGDNRRQSEPRAIDSPE